MKNIAVDVVACCLQFQIQKRTQNSFLRLSSDCEKKAKRRHQSAHALSNLLANTNSDAKSHD